MKWEAVKELDGKWYVVCGSRMLGYTGKILPTSATKYSLSEYSARANAAWANEHGPWPKGHEKYQGPIDWGVVGDDAVNKRIQKVRNTCSQYTHGNSGVACTLDAIEALGWQWRHEFSGLWSVRKDAESGHYHSNVSLACALCFALDGEGM